jgi:predicted dehydrogenase
VEIVRIGVLGYGYWGPNLARNIAGSPATELAAIADLDTNRLVQARRAHPVARLTTEFETVISDPSIDAVAIATPAATHFALASRAIANGKHVLVTKPLATRLKDAITLVDMARRMNVKILVDHTFLFTGAVRRMKQYIDDGELGDLYYFDSTRINLGIFQHDANVIWDLAPHDLSILAYLVDRPVRSVAAIGARHLGQAMENMAYVTLQYDDGFLAHIHVNWLAPAKVRQTIVGGSKKMLVFNDMEMSDKLRVYDSGAEIVETAEDIYRTLVEYRTGDVLSPKIDKTEALQVEIEHFARVCRGKDDPISSGDLGITVVRLIEAAQVSLRSGGVPVGVSL